MRTHLPFLHTPLLVASAHVMSVSSQIHIHPFALSPTPTSTASSTESSLEFRHPRFRHSQHSSTTSLRSITDDGNNHSMWYELRDVLPAYPRLSTSTAPTTYASSESEYGWASDSDIRLLSSFPLPPTANYGEVPSFKDTSILFYSSDYYASDSKSLAKPSSVTSLCARVSTLPSPPSSIVPLPLFDSRPPSIDRKRDGFLPDAQAIVKKCLVQLSTHHVASAFCLLDLLRVTDMKPLELDIDDILEVFVDLRDPNTTPRQPLDPAYFHGIINQIVPLTLHSDQYDAWLALELLDAKGTRTLLVVHEDIIRAKFKPHFQCSVRRYNTRSQSTAYEDEPADVYPSPPPSTADATSISSIIEVAEPASAKNIEPCSRFSAYTDDGELEERAKGRRHRHGPILRTDGTWTCGDTKCGCHRLPLSTRVFRLLLLAFSRIKRRS